MPKLTRRNAIGAALVGAATPTVAIAQETATRTRRSCLIPVEPAWTPTLASAALERGALMIDALRAPGWLDSEERAARFLRYLERCATGKRDNAEWQEAVVDFLRDNGQSLNWLLTGDVKALICRLGVAAWVEHTEPA